MEKCKYSRELLEEILTEGEATLLGEYDKFNQRIHVKFQCKCGKEETKRFEMLKLYRLAYCKSCSLKRKEEKKQSTCLEKYGVTNSAATPYVREKIKEVFQMKFGGHPKKTKEVQEKWMETCFKKYGGHPNQNPDVQEKLEKSSYRFKNYTLPSGTVVRIQGYEDKALDTLLKIYKEEEIILGRKNIPRIEYFIGDTRHIYYPDLFIPKENKIIEVKSEWTCQLKRSYVEEKAEATARAGYIYEVWIYNTSEKSLKKNIYVYIEEDDNTS